jgi:glycosyltransferase involved in cell wall biosynthesis
MIGAGLSTGDASITVVIPVWDRYVSYLEAAIDSVRRDAPDARIVVVDNASTLPVIPAPGVSLVRAPRRLSVGAARNLGLDHVATKYVALLDADDEFLPGTLDFLRSRLDSDSTVSVSATSAIDSATGRRHRFPKRPVARLTRWRRLFALLHSIWSLYPIQGCSLLRTAQVRDAGGYPDVDWGDDWVLAVSLAFRGRVELHERPGRRYRDNPGSLWRGGREPGELARSTRLVRQRLRDDRGVPTWARRSVPLIAVLQLVALHVLRPAYVAAQRLRSGARQTPRAG